MTVVITMPDGSEQEFEDLSSAKAYKKALLSDPNVGGALKLTGDPAEAEKFLTIQGKGQALQKGTLENQKLRRELEGPTARESLASYVDSLEGSLGKMPVAQRGPFAIAQGSWKKLQGKMGYEPMRSFMHTREALATMIRKPQGDSGAPSNKDIERLVKQIPDITDPMETRQAKFEILRRGTGLPTPPPAPGPWQQMSGAARRHAIQAPSGGQIR